MFISNDVAEERLRDSKNVLTRINKNERSDVPRPDVPEPPIVDMEDVEIEVLEAEDMTCSTAKNVDMSPSPALLRKMLNMKSPRTRLSTEVQASIAIMGALTTKAAAARLFDVGRSHSEDLAQGYTSQKYRYDGGTYKDGSSKKQELVDLINIQKAEVRDLAFEKLTKSLVQMTDDKLTSLQDPVKLARVARDLSTVLDKVLPTEDSQPQNVHFHVWRPEMADESDYKTIHVGGQE